ncbi:MAG: hypothetical protein LBU32_17870 [Clostridiales bacterium]|nr:hypothetical protein [Clostridiales bacterium]
MNRKFGGGAVSKYEILSARIWSWRGRSPGALAHGRGRRGMAPSISAIPAPALRRGSASAAEGLSAALRKKGEVRAACPRLFTPRRRTGTAISQGKYWMQDARRNV